jgi:ribose 5-phosphate isomerase B
MRIGVASDHAGYVLKPGILEFLQAQGVEVIDYGCAEDERVDYVDYAVKALKGYFAGECDRLILICGTGIGMSITANKHRGIRAALCVDMYMAEMSRAHNDANCLTLGGRILPLDEAELIVATWLNTDYEGGRHQERLDKIADIEEKNFRKQRE